MRSEMLDAMQKAGTPQHLVYAYEKTGLIVNEHGYKNLSPEDRAAYDAALQEYWANEERETGP
jgi:hypothetical protein